MNLLDKIRGKSETEELLTMPPESMDTTIDTRGPSFDATRAAESTLAGVESLVPADAPTSIISQAVPTEPGPVNEQAEKDA